MSIKWDDAAIPWRNIDSTVEDIYLAEDSQSYQPIEQGNATDDRHPPCKILKSKS
jgi:hypothetical protein